VGFATVGILRMPMPGVLPGKSSTVKVGTPGDFPVSSELVRVPGQNLYVGHDADGYWAMSAICTHLGCVVSVTPEGFACPCHGSKFSPQGKVLRGPAPSPLTWYEIGLAPDGQLVVDLKRSVPAGIKYSLA
jgi:cytochrome b6-f complex iron-sulfur subunit